MTTTPSALQWYPGNHISPLTYLGLRLPGYHWGAPLVTMTPSVQVTANILLLPFIRDVNSIGKNILHIGV